MGFTAATQWISDDTGRFEVRGVIGRGAHSVVLRGYDRETQTEVALKVLEGWDPQSIYRLKREFRILRSLRHPALVEMYELFSGRAGSSFFSMELVDGGPFVAEIPGEVLTPESPPRQPLAPDACAALLLRARDLVSALNLVHAAGIVHRDVKPSNVLERRSGGVVLLDFGLAAHREPEGIERLIERGPAGTWAYMAPEAILGRPATPACDWYSLAVLLFEAITGQPAFHGSAAEVWQAKQMLLAEKSSLLAGRVPERVAALIVASLNPDPAGRPDGTVWTEVLDEACRAQAAPGLGAALVFPEAERRGTFVGRESELAWLEGLYRQVVRGRTVAVHIEGPGGIGKTELVHEFLRRLPLAEGPLVLRGRCHWQESLPFNAVDGIVDELALWLSPEGHLQHLALPGPEGNALARMFPVLRTLVAADPANLAVGTQPREARRMAFEALRGLLVQLSETRPLVLWIDDVQWADVDSVSLLEAVLRPPEAPRALLILCHRLDQEGALSPFASAAQRRSWADVVHVLSLGPLDERAAARLVEGARAGRSLPVLGVRAILDEAGGSPLLLVQLARHAWSGGGGAEDTLGLLLPDVVGAWMERLPSPARRILELTAVAARPLERSLLLRMAGLGERGRPFVALLESALLLQTSRAGDRVFVEPYHQRIGEALYNRVPVADAQRVHALLAASLAAEATVEEERIFFHWRAAGRFEEASEWAKRAAERAFGQLAFEQAAELYAEALTLGGVLPAAAAKEIEGRRAEALVNAGRGAEAAAVFLRMGRKEQDPNLVDELQRRAAEELLMSGHVAEGTAVLQTVLERVGADFPRTPAVALRRSVLALLPLWLAERRARAYVARGRRPEAETRSDVYHAAAKGLSLVDPSRGLYFSLAALRWALRSADLHRLARSLSFVGSNLLPFGGMFSRWATNMIDRAGAIARMTGDAYLQAVTTIGLAQVRMMECRWEDMSLLCEQALAVLRAECRGVAWEMSIATMAKFRALEECGALSELRRQASSWAHDANRTGNRYAEVTALLYEGMGVLASGKPEAARALAAESRRLWVQAGFHVQHFYAARLAALCQLYEGNPVAAVSGCAEMWPALRRGGFLRHAIFRLDALVLQGRLALACMLHDPLERKQHTRQVEGVVRQLERERRTDASAWALVFRAALASAQAKLPLAVEFLNRAEQKFESARMPQGAAVAAFRTGELWPTAAGEAARQRALNFFAGAGVASPEAWVGTLAPGFAPRKQVVGPTHRAAPTLAAADSVVD